MPPVDLSEKLVIGVSSRALFNLEEENKIFNEGDVNDFLEYQYANEDKIIEKGTAFPLIEGLLNLNKSGDKLVEVVIMSKNSPDISMRILNSLKYYDLNIERLVFTGGENLSPYLEAYSVDLFLSKSFNDVQNAIDKGTAGVLVYNNPNSDIIFDKGVVKLAFDADAVIFSDESEVINKIEGLPAFLINEKKNESIPLNEGPFSKLIKVISKIQDKFPIEQCPIKMVIVTARSAPAHMRIIKTLRVWGVYMDAIFFLGGVSKNKVLETYKPHFFFDDQDLHVGPASKIVPSGRVPYHSDSKLNNIDKLSTPPSIRKTIEIKLNKFIKKLSNK